MDKYYLYFLQLVNDHSLKPGNHLYNAVALSGEAGEVANVIKKMTIVQLHPEWANGNNGLPSKDELREMLKDEMGDMLFYFARIAKDNGFDLIDIMDAQAEKLNQQDIKYKRIFLK